MGSKNASWLLLNRITGILMSTEMVTFAFGCCEEEAGLNIVCNCLSVISYIIHEMVSYICNFRFI